MFIRLTHAQTLLAKIMYVIILQQLLCEHVTAIYETIKNI